MQYKQMYANQMVAIYLENMAALHTSVIGVGSGNTSVAIAVNTVKKF